MSSIAFDLFWYFVQIHCLINQLIINLRYPSRNLLPVCLMDFLSFLLLFFYSSCLHTPVILLPIIPDSCIKNLSTDRKCLFFFCSLPSIHSLGSLSYLTWTHRYQVWTWNYKAAKYLSPYILPSSIQSSNWKITDCPLQSGNLLMFFSPLVFGPFVIKLLNWYQIFWITVRIIEKRCKDFGTCHLKNFF